MDELAAIYERISDDREGRELGVERQREDNTTLAERLGLIIYGRYRDNDIGASTRSRKPRPEYQRLLADAKTGKFRVIIAYTSGRLTRRPREHEDLIDLAEQHGVRFVYVKSPSFDLNTAAGRRVARILAANDAGEAEDIAERVSRASRQRAEQGLNHGGRRTYGYGLIIGQDEQGNDIRDYHALVPAEAAEVAKIYADLIRGVPLGAIVRDLNARQVPTVTGKPWTPATVRGIIERPSNAGLSEHKGEIVGTGRWPAIVSQDVYETALALLRDPSRRTSTGNKASYLLSGLGVCGGCGGTISSGGVKRSSATTGIRRIYLCRARHCVGRRQDWIDQYVSAAIIERMSRPDARELLVDEDRPDTEALRDEARALRARLDILATEFADGSLTASQLRTATDRLRGRLAEVEAAQVHPTRALVLAELIEADDVGAAWNRMPLDRQRAVLAVLATVTLHPGGGGRRSFDSSYVTIDWKV